MIKKIVSALTIVLVFALGIFLWNVKQEDQKKMEMYEQQNELRRPLKIKQQDIEKQLVQLEKDYESSKLPKGTTQVIFTGLEAEVYSICYPIMKELEYTGTLAISLTQLPGMEGLMNVEQFQQLINEGWDVCIKWDSVTSSNVWWPQLQKKMKELDLETCPVVYFTSGTYTKSLDTKLQGMGFSVVVHHGEEDNALIQLAEEEGIWHLGAVGLMGEKPKLRLTEAIAQKGNITYLVGFQLEDEKYDERSFRSMLNYFDRYENSSELIVADIEEARQHYRERLTGYDQAKEEQYQQDKAALEEELATVKKQIEDVEAQGE